MADVPYLNSKLSVEQRVEDLLSRMTAEEKAGQLCQMDGRLHTEKLIKEYFIGSLLHVYGDSVREIQQWAASTRLKIPVLLGIDAIHGHAFYPESTVFPTQLALSSSWNTECIELAAHYTAREVILSGVHRTFSPVLCLSRDLRWGRIDETFGEDIYLVGECAKAMVRGYQGKNLSEPYSILACAKHYAGYSETQGGRDASEADLTRRKLLSGFLPAFEAVSKEECATFMIAYQSIDGVPCSANRWLLTEILKDSWGFSGFTITDWDNIGRMVREQMVSSTLEDAIEKAINAGTDMAMSTAGFVEALLQCLKKGKVSQSTIDMACRRVLKVKFQLGLFEGKKLYPDGETAKIEIGCAKHREHAIECACQSIVLLKNQDALLPLGNKIKKIGIFGPNADDMDAQLGDWSFHSFVIGKEPEKHSRDKIVTVLDGIKNRTKDGYTVEYIRGCSVVEDGYDEIDKAAAMARTCDVAIAVVGDTLPLIGETHDRAILDLSGKQQVLLEALKSTGVPLVVILINSKPLSIQWVKANANAILEAWNPGMGGGTAIASVLFGDRVPEGKLTISFPYHVGQLPVYYNQIPGWHAPRYVDLPKDPLFPFGFGLSYTSFHYSNLRISRNTIRNGEDVQVSVDVENTGSCDGIEIVQLYVNDVVSSVTTPIKQLKGFSRVHLPKGKKMTVVLPLAFESLSLINEKCEKVVEPGVFEVMVGSSSADTDLLKTQLTVL